MNEDELRALAAGTPWGWTTLRVAAQVWPGDDPDRDRVRAWIRRPGNQRVETLDGQLLQVDRPPSHGMSGHLHLVSRTVGRPRKSGQPIPIADLPADIYTRSTDELPMFDNYRWLAQLAPVELGSTRDPADDAPPPVTFDEIHLVDHHSRQAVEAIARPATSYEPLCPCCELLPSEHTCDESKHGPCTRRHATAHRVRLDVATGVCVATEELDGDDVGRGHELVIEAVDEPMDDALFTAPRRTFSWRW